MSGKRNNDKGASFLVGIDQYDDPSLKNFRKSSSVRGVQALKQILSKPESQYWAPQPDFELVDAVTYMQLDRQLRAFLENENYTDVLLYFSGHGYQCWNDDYGKYEGYLATSSSDISASSFKDETGKILHQNNGLAFVKIARLIAAAKHLKSLVLLIDACHSGHAIATDVLANTLYELRMSSSKKADADRFKYCIIPSCLDSQVSWVEDGLGVLTQALVTALDDPTQGPITAEGLAQRIKERLISRHQQTIKPDHSGYILLMDNPSTDDRPAVVAPPIPDEKDPTKPKNPYQSLEAFDQNSCEFFFGREAFVSEIIEQFEQTNFVPIIGASGSGKSSVVKAGLFPELAASEQWELMACVPGEDPLGNLTSTLEKGLTKAMEPSKIPGLGSFIRRPNQEKFTQLLEQLQPLAADRKFLLLIDQFEETFTLANRVEDPEERQAILEDQTTFLKTIAAVNKPLYIVVTMRADFLSACLEEPDLCDLIQSYAVYIPPLRGQALRDAIRKPAVRQGGHVDDDLVDQLEREVADEPGALPLLEFALTQLWQQQERGETVLTLDAYNKLGVEEAGTESNRALAPSQARPESGLKRALNSHADAIYHRRDPVEQGWMRQLFLQLIRPGEETRDTRQRQRKANLLEIAGERETQPAEHRLFEQLLQDLVQARLLVTGPPEQTRSADELENLSGDARQQWAEDNQVVDLAHEALIEGWQCFRNWREETRELRRLRAQIEDQRKLWEQAGQSDENAMPRGMVARVDVVWEQLQPLLRREGGRSVDEDFYNRSRDFWEAQDAAEKRRNAELEKALLEAQLQLKAIQVETKLSVGRRREALTLAVEIMGENWEKLPEKILGSVQKSIVSCLEPVRFVYPDIATFAGHTGSVNAVAVSADGQTIVSGSWDKTVRIWRTDGILLRILKGHIGSVNAVAVSADGQTVVSGSDDNTVQIWRTDGVLLRTLEGHTEPVWAVAVSADGQTIVSGSDDKTVRIWRTDGILLRSLEGHTDPVRAVALSADGQTIVSGSDDNTVRIWRTDGTPLRSLEGHTNSVRAVAVSADGQTIVSGSDDKTVRIWHTDGTLLRSLEVHTDPVWAVAVSADGQTIVSGSWDKTVRQWCVDGTPQHTLEGHASLVCAVALSADGQTIVSGSWDKTVRLCRVDNTPLHTLEGHIDPVRAVALSADGQTIVSSSNDNIAQLYRVDGTPLHTLEGHREPVCAVAVSADGQTIVSGGRDNTVRIWRTDGTLLRSLEGHTDSVRAVAVSTDGQTIVSGGRDKTVRIWRTDGTLLRSLEDHADSVRAVAVSADGQTIVSGSDDNTARIWHTDGTPLRSLEDHTDAVRAVAVSADGQTIVSGSDDNTVRIWRTDGTLLRSLEGHTDAVRAVAVSADGQTIVSGSDDNTVRIWRTDGTPLRSLEGHTNSVRAVAVSVDGQTIVSGSLDDTVRVWSVDGILLHSLESHTGDVNAVALSADSQTLVSGSSDNTVRLWHWCGWRSGLDICLKILEDDWQDDPRKLRARTRLFAAGYTLCEQGDLESGLTKLKLALQCGETDQAVRPSVQGQEALTLAQQLDRVKQSYIAPIFLSQGHQAALCGEYDRSLQLFVQAQDYGLAIDPEKKAKQLCAPVFKTWGTLNALQLKFSDAEACFKQAQQYGLEINPEAEVKRIAALGSFEKAKVWVRDRVRQDDVSLADVQNALVAYQTAQALNPELEIATRDWNTLLWYGSLHAAMQKRPDLIEALLAASQKALEAEPENTDCWDTLGVAKVLTQDQDCWQSAIEDFQYYIAYSDASSERKEQRQCWIDTLSEPNPKNPFTSADIQTLFGQ